MKPNQPYSIYIHIPFCQHRCSYCDFNTFSGQGNRIPDYVTALCREIQLLGHTASLPIPVTSIYFGGGTPSLLSPYEIENILSKLTASFQLNNDIEITMEANPGTIDQLYLRDIHDLGVNRLSLGVQSIHPGELTILDRIHDTYDTINSIEWAKIAGFDNLNIDLIYGIPHQTLRTWEKTLSLSSQFELQHLSLYSLTIEESTPMFSWISKGLLPAPDDDLAADMYILAEELLLSAGFQQYEVSNWARERNTFSSDSLDIHNHLYSCRHNLQYWHNQPYIGLGAGAHGYVNNYRLANVNLIDDYIKRFNQDLSGFKFPYSPATNRTTPISREDEIQETMMVGLRLTREGVSEQKYHLRFLEEMTTRYRKQIDYLITSGLLEWSGDKPNRSLRLTAKGRLLGNRVFMEFL